jgi:uncharacterized protein (DUF2126 family)
VVSPALQLQATALQRLTAATLEQRLQDAGIILTFGGEPTYVPIDPVGPEWSVTADGPTKLSYARALATELQQRVWPGSTLLLCPGKRYDGEVNPRWTLRLIADLQGQPLVSWPSRQDRPPLSAAAALDVLESIGSDLGCRLKPLPLRDPLQSDRQVWAAPLCHDEANGWSAAAWPLEESMRELSGAPGPAGLRLPLQHFPEGVLQQVLTLERDDSGWSLFLPPVAREPLETLLEAIAKASQHCAPPDLSGVLPLDGQGHWQVLGLTADPGVLEVNLPVCGSWEEYALWLQVLEEAGEAVGLRSWKQGLHRREGTGGGNHLLWGGPTLEDNPFFPRPAWLVGILRYWQHHPSLAYLFCGDSVGPASQAPRPDEGSASWLDLTLAHAVLSELGSGDQRVPISETLRHLHADKSGNTHRSEISLDKFWNPAWMAGCQGLLEFRAIESMPDHRWSSAVALLWRSLAVLLLEPNRRPKALQPFGATLHDRQLLPSQLWEDLMAVLGDLAAAGLPQEEAIFRAIWTWRFPQLLQWQDGEASLEIRRALEPWPLLCDTPVEGGSTSRFIDSSLRRFEVITNPAFRERHTLLLKGRPLPLPAAGEVDPLGVRYRQERLYPCLHPVLAPDVPLQLDLLTTGSHPAVLQSWVLHSDAEGFIASPPGALAPGHQAQPWQGAWPEATTVDLRLP